MSFPEGTHGTEHHDELRNRLRETLRRTVLPYADDWEARKAIPSDHWRALADAGLFAFDRSGAGFVDSAALLEELGYTGYAGVRAAIGVHAFMAPYYLGRFGTAEQQSAYLPAISTGARIAALALSERDAGSDLRHIRTHAVSDGEGVLRVSGSKCHVANGSRAGLFVALVRTRSDPPPGGLTGASLMIVDADLPGVTRTPEPMLGWHAADVCRIDFDEVPVPADRVLGRVDRALTQLMRGLAFERLVAGLLAVGGVGYALDLLDDFVRRHQVRDQPLSANQAIRHRIADLRSEFELVRQYGRHAARVYADGLSCDREATVLKLRATELAVEVARAAVQYHGARGYLEDSVTARLHRDAVAGTIAGGASELLRDAIFEDA